MKHLIFAVIIGIVTSCGGNRFQNEAATDSMVNPKLKSNSETFDKNLITSLYQKLKSDFEIDFSQDHLESLLLNLDMPSLKAGKEVEKEMLFEDFKCDCHDKIRITYSKLDGRFILWVYEEFYEEDLDWCPESTFSYSFQIKGHEIIDLKLDYMAG